MRLTEQCTTRRSLQVGIGTQMPLLGRSSPCCSRFCFPVLKEGVGFACHELGKWLVVMCLQAAILPHSTTTSFPSPAAREIASSISHPSLEMPGVGSLPVSGLLYLLRYKPPCLLRIKPWHCGTCGTTYRDEWAELMARLLHKQHRGHHLRCACCACAACRSVNEVVCHGIPDARCG